MAECCIVMILTACSIIASPQKRVAGDYYLIQWEDFTTYYLEETRSNGTRRIEDGTPGGGVLRIGWSKEHIVYKRGLSKRTSETDWIIIDVERHEVQGPFSEEQIVKLKEKSPVLRSIKIYEVEDAWKRLWNSRSFDSGAGRDVGP